MNNDGTLAQQLTMNTQTTGNVMASIGTCSFRWSHASRDGNMYAIKANGSVSASDDYLVFGKEGSAPTSFATSESGLSGDVVGWTTV